MKRKILITISIILILIVSWIALYNMKKNTNDNLNRSENVSKNSIIETEEKLKQNKLITQEEAKKLIEEKFNLATELINLNKEFEILSEPTEFIEENEIKTYYYEISNYDEVCEKYFTNNAKKYFDKNANCLVWIENKPYIAEGGASPNFNAGIEIKNIKIQEDMIQSTIEMKLFNTDANEDLGKVESTFKLKKENQIWKIEEFLSEYDLEKWNKVEY